MKGGRIFAGHVPGGVFVTEDGGRTWAEANRGLPEVTSIYDIATSGDRLFVGPTDLRKTPYSDAYLYYLLPEYPPGTYYIEMDPGVANADDSRMASDLARSDIAILSGVWNDWAEPNDSRKFGSTASTVHPPSGSGPARRVPPSRLARSAMPTRP